MEQWGQMRTERCEMFGGPEDGRQVLWNRRAPIEFPVLRNLRMEWKEGADLPSLADDPPEVVRYRFSGAVRNGVCLFFEVGRRQPWPT